MSKQGKITKDASTGVSEETAVRLVRDFLTRHGKGLDSLLGRFPGVSGAAYRGALEKHLSEPATMTEDLILALEHTVDTLLALQGADCRVLEADEGPSIQVDAGVRWYAARFSDLAQAARRM